MCHIVNHKFTMNTFDFAGEWDASSGREGIPEWSGCGFYELAPAVRISGWDHGAWLAPRRGAEGVGCRYRWCRRAQPPARGWDASGIGGEAAQAAPKRESLWVKLARPLALGGDSGVPLALENQAGRAAIPQIARTWRSIHLPIWAGKSRAPCNTRRSRTRSGSDS